MGGGSVIIDKGVTQFKSGVIGDSKEPKFSEFESAAYQIEQDEVGRSLSRIRVKRTTTVTDVLIGLVSITSKLGIVGAVVALFSQVLSVVGIEIDPALLEGTFVCQGEMCVVTIGLTFLTAMEWVVATAGFAIGLFGHLGVHAYRMAQVQTDKERMEETIRDARIDRYIVIGLGRITFHVGVDGLRIKGPDRDFLIRWSAISSTDLYYDVPVPGYQPLPKIYVDLPRTDLRTFIRKELDSPAYDDLREALKIWCDGNDYLDLPIESGRENAESIREWIRVPKRFFANKNSDITWLEFIALVWFCVPCRPG